MGKSSSRKKWRKAKLRPHMSVVWLDEVSSVGWGEAIAALRPGDTVYIRESWGAGQTVLDKVSCPMNVYVSTGRCLPIFDHAYLDRDGNLYQPGVSLLLGENEMPEGSQITVDFTGVDEVPFGETLLALTKVESKVSSAGNKMLSVQMKVVDSNENQAHIGRVVFDNLMLETGAVWKTKQALEAFLGEIPDGPNTFDAQDLVGKQAWCLLEVEEGKGDYAGTKRARVSRYGITPK